MAAIGIPEEVVVSRKEIVALRDAEEAYREAQAALTSAENAVKPLRLALAAKVLGIQSMDELKKMDPDEVETTMRKREAKLLWAPAYHLPKFRFVKTAAGRYPAWKAEFIARASEVEAERITAAAPTLYSYRVEVAA